MTLPQLKGLRLRMLLFAAAALLPLLALMGYLAWREGAEKLDQERTRASHLADLLARDQILPFALGRQLLQGLALVPAVAHPVDKAACQRVLARAFSAQPFLSTLNLFSPGGEALCSAAIGATPSVADRAYFKESVGSKGLVVSDYLIGKVTGKSVVAMALPLLDERGTVRAVLVAGLDLAWMGRALAEVPVAAGTNIVLVDAHGTVLAPPRWLGRSVAEHPVFQRIAGSTAMTSFEAQGVDGVQRIFVAKPLNPALGGQTYLWVAVPKHSASEAALRDFLGNTLLVFATVLTLFAAIWWEGSRLVLQPVERLRQAAARLGTARPSERTHLPHTDDAIGQLATTFDDMAESIETREAELGRSRQSLLRANRNLRMLSAVKDLIGDATSEPALFDALCRSMAQLGGYPTVYVARADDDAGKSVVVLAAEGIPAEERQRLNISWGDNERGQGVAGTAVRENRPCLIHDVRSDPRFAPWRAMAVSMGYEAVIALPLRVAGRAWGVLALASTQPGVFDEEETQLLEELAADLGHGIETLRLRATKEAAEEALHRANEELERRVRERTTELERANRELEAFSYSISHDLRAPLRSMDGFAQVLDEDYGALLDAAGKEHLGRIRKAAQRMGLLIDDIIDLARLSQSEMNVRDVDLSALAAEIAAELASAQPDREVKLRIAPGLAARGDRSLLRIFMQNLLENAWKYTSKRADAEVEFGCVQLPSGEAAYFVRDNGAGFDMAFADRLFRPFTRLHRVEDFTGTGIGLATVARIAERHGGRVWAEAEKGKGATFYFTLP